MSVMCVFSYIFAFKLYSITKIFIHKNKRKRDDFSVSYKKNFISSILRTIIIINTCEKRDKKREMNKTVFLLLFKITIKEMLLENVCVT